MSLRLHQQQPMSYIELPYYNNLLVYQFPYLQLRYVRLRIVWCAWCRIKSNTGQSCRINRKTFQLSCRIVKQHLKSSVVMLVDRPATCIAFIIHNEFWVVLLVSAWTVSITHLLWKGYPVLFKIVLVMWIIVPSRRKIEPFAKHQMEWLGLSLWEPCV